MRTPRTKGCAEPQFLFLGRDPLRNAVNGKAAAAASFAQIVAGTYRPAMQQGAFFAPGVQFDNNRSLGLVGPDMTILCRMRWQGTGAHILFSIRDPANLNGAGIILFVSDSGGEDGFNLAVFKDGTFYELNSKVGAGGSFDHTRFFNRSVVIGGSYSAASSRITLYWNGEVLCTSTDSSHAWNLDANYVTWVGRQASGNEFQGDIEWCGAWNRVLSPSEVTSFCDDMNWEFDKRFLMVPLRVTSGSYATHVSVNQISTLFGDSITYRTGVDSIAQVGGDIHGGGVSPPTVATYSTQVAVNQTASFSIPQLVMYSTIVSANPSTNLVAPVKYGTVVGVHDRSTFTVDGRSDIINSVHYRR